MGKILLEEVIQNDLLMSGHYQVNEKICSRDWIDTEKLVQEKGLKEKIVYILEKMIMSCIKDSDFIILGIGTIGLQIGSILAYRLCSPFLHIVPKHLEEYYDEHETNKMQLDSNLKYIIITDVIITGITIKEVCLKYDIEMSDVIGIYSIFKRPFNTEKIKFGETEVLNKAQAINTDFDAELRIKEKCKLYNQCSKCIRKNKIFN